MNKLTTIAKQAVGKIKFEAVKHSPELLITLGIASGVATVVLACRATLKAETTVKEKAPAIVKVRDELAELEDPDEIKAKKKELAKSYLSLAGNIAKEYSPAIACGALSVTSILSGTHVMKSRNAALAAAYTAVDNAFHKYRDNVVERFGKDVDMDMKLGRKEETVEETVTNKKGEEKVVKKKVTTISPVICSPYARFFDESSIGWKPDAEQNLKFLRDVQDWANDKLRYEGYLFLNEVYKALGLPPSKAGQQVGWVYDKNNSIGDNYVDFGIYDLHNEANRNFVNGYERSILIEPNVDGPILNKMHWEE